MTHPFPVQALQELQRSASSHCLQKENHTKWPGPASQTLGQKLCLSIPQFPVKRPGTELQSSYNSAVTPSLERSPTFPSRLQPSPWSPKGAPLSPLNPLCPPLSPLLCRSDSDLCLAIECNGCYFKCDNLIQKPSGSSTTTSCLPGIFSWKYNAWFFEFKQIINLT